MQRHTTHTLADLIAECDEVRAIAMSYEREYKDRNGNVKSCAAPDGRTALAATELKAKLLGYLGKDSALTPEQARAELKRLGFKVVRQPA